MSQHDPLAAAREIFIVECRDMLQTMEDALLQLEIAPDDAETINALFRAAHTIKGSAGLFGLVRIVGFAHVVENVLDRARDGELRFDGELIALLLRCRDHLGLLLAEAIDDAPSDNTVEANTTLGDMLVERLAACLGAPTQAAAALPVADAQIVAVTSGQGTDADHWHISVRFGADVMRDGMDPLSVVRYLATLGRIASISTLFDAMPDADGMDPESCYLGCEIALVSTADRNTIAEAFDFIRDACTLHILPPHSKVEEYIALIEALPEDPLRLGEILVRSGCLTEPELQAGLAHQQSELRTGEPASPLGEILLNQDTVQAPVLNAALEKQQRVRDKLQQENLFIRVRADKLDRLINLVGELVVAGAGVNLRAQRAGDAALLEATQTVAGLVEQIRDDALQLRMVPIAETFGRFNRVVRDTSKELGKEIALEIEGADNELDKSMVEKLVDPLTHLVRNAMDHGIETPEVRLAAGKPAQGTIRLTARHESGSFVIEIADDGAGLRRERILAKAIERGLTTPGRELSDAEVYQFIFSAGFSTAETVTDLSGRGVGMDVVRRNIDALRGSIGVDSQAGRGTRITLRLPLTLAIIDGFLVGVGKAQYVLPLDLVVECVELSDDVRHGTHGRNFINLRGEVLPFLRLREMFGLGLPGASRENVVVMQYGAQRAGLVVDDLLGEFQTVIKPLSKLFSQLRGVAGSTILGGGDVALILDVPALIQRATQNELRELETC